MPVATQNIREDARRVILQECSDGLIKAEIAEMKERDRLEEAIRECAATGLPLDDISEATGLMISEIRKIIDRPLRIDDLDHLLGIR